MSSRALGSRSSFRCWPGAAPERDCAKVPELRDRPWGRITRAHASFGIVGDAPSGREMCPSGGPAYLGEGCSSGTSDLNDAAFPDDR